MASLVRDIRIATRTLLRRPRYAWIAALTIGLGIGLNTTVFGLVSAVLLRPLPYPESSRLVEVYNQWDGTPIASISPAEFLDFDRDLAGSAEAFGVWAFGGVSLTDGLEPLRLRGAFLSAGAAEAFGVAPLRGRWYTAEEERTGVPVVLISEGIWRSQFGSDPGIIGRDVTLDGSRNQVIGVTPADFRLPQDYQEGQASQIFAPLGLDPTTTARGSHFLTGVARLAPGVTVERMETAVAATAQRFVADFPGDYPSAMGFASHVRAITERIQGNVESVLALLLGAALAVLLVTCATVGNLFLVRLDERRREITIRRALGASRGSLVGYLLLESVLVSAIGAAVGIAIAAWALPSLPRLMPPGLPLRGGLRFDGTVLAFAGGAGLLSGLLVALVPAIVLGTRGFRQALATLSRGDIEGGSDWPRRVLVTAQVALALVLLSGAGALGRSLLKLARVDPGFDGIGTLTARLTAPGTYYPDSLEVVSFFRSLETRLADRPEIAAAGAVVNLPLASGIGDLNFRIEGRPVPEGEVSPRADWQAVTPGYFAAMGLRLRDGRLIDRTDDETSPGVVVINRTMAAQYWPDGNAMGARFALGGGAGPGLVTVIGIVADVRHTDLASAPPSQMYLAHAQFRYWIGGGPARNMTLVLRPRSGGPVSLVPVLTSTLRSVDDRIPLSNVQTMGEVRSTALSQERMLFSVAGVFAGLALVLGALGIYGVVAFTVARRTREIGMRMALGAEARGVTGMVLGQGTTLVVVGLGTGLLLSLLLSRVLRGLLYEVRPLDPLAMATAAMLLGGVALLATYLPARRAARINPMEALRHE